jgi:voltage-gated potassium channel
VIDRLLVVRKPSKKKIAEIFVTVLTAISVVVILIDHVYNLTESQRLAIYVFDSIVVLILAIDFYKRMKSSNGTSTKFILKHWYEIPAMIPIFVFDIAGLQTLLGAGLRSVRLIRLFRLLQLFFRTTEIFRESKFLYLITFSAGAIIIGAVAEYIVESPIRDAKITSLADAFWWAMATVTTVGYGDVYPITTEGRIIGSLIMIGGIAIIGIFISTLGAILTESRLKVKRDASPKLANEAKELIKKKIDELEKLDEEDLNTLMAMISSLNNALKKSLIS